MNPATEYVQSLQEQSPIHEYLADNGSPVNWNDIEHIRVAGRPVSVSEGLTEDELGFVAGAIRETTPTAKACFANSLKMWEYDDRFEYTEGFAGVRDLDVGGLEHAWCMLDGEKLVDVTNEFDHYHGTVIEDADVLQRHTDNAMKSYGILGNHHNQFQFLRERGYIDR